MRIGVVCEGPTDFHAIEQFLAHSLRAAGVEAKFEALQPKLDKTQLEGGGWANVLLWLKNNPPAARIQQYFGGGLFGGNLTLSMEYLFIWIAIYWAMNRFITM